MKSTNPLLPPSILTKSQKKVLTKENVTYTDKDGHEQKWRKVVCELRYDDDCNNGHNSFAITGDFWRAGNRDARNPDMGGCCHDDLAIVFPELAHWIQWHLVSSDGPMHYIANTLYYARTVDTDGKQPGDPIAFDTRIKFGDFPITFRMSDKFTQWLQSLPCDARTQEVVTIPHDNTKDGYQFKPKYSVSGYPATKWHDCPFDTEQEALEFLSAMQSYPIKFVEIPTKWARAVEPNLEAARRSACWPDATLDQLQDVAQLEARLPALMHEFKNAMESVGFTY